MASTKKLVEKCSEGDKLSAAKLMTLLESGDKGAKRTVRNAKLLNRPHIIGVTGEGGAGKSTLINALIGRLLKDGNSIGAILCDPVSPKTKGAILGDRIRLQEHFLDPRVFIRSVAARNYRGGIASCVKDIVKVMGLLKKDVILIETVGTGQQETGVRELVDTLILVVKPDFGDHIQLLKSGIREVSDILCVPKKSLYPQIVENLVRLLEDEIRQGSFKKGEWQPKVVGIDAFQKEEIDQVISHIYEHRDYLLRKNS